MGTRAFETLKKQGVVAAANDEIKARMHLEEGLVYHYVQDNKKSKICFQEAKDASGLTVELTGQLGVRTKFQAEKKAQLVVKASSKKAVSADSTAAVLSQAPSEVPLDEDNILLEKPKLDVAEGEEEEGFLNALDQAILLSLCLDVKNNNPSHGLTTEEMGPYVQRALDRSNNWMVHTMGLLLKTRLEGEKGRTVERSVLQLQVIVDQYRDVEPGAAHRMQFIYDVAFPPMFELSRELGLRLMSIGAVRSAIEQFQKLEMWEECIQCHMVQENMNKARSLVEERLAVEPNNPLLWCLRGEISKDPADFEKAWQVSGNRFARAKRSLGSYYYNKGQYVESIEHYQQALELSPLYPSSWFIMGVAAIRSSQWDTALEAFSQVVQQEPDDAESWTNISSVYMYQKDYRKAFRALQEALRFKYDNWKIWENLLYCCMNLGEYGQAISAVNRIIKVREEKEVNTDVLFTLVKVLNAMKTKDERAYEAMSVKLEELLRVVTARISLNPDVWDAYALYFEVIGNDEQRIEMRQKHVRTLQVSGWEREASKFKCVVLGVEYLIDAQLEAAGRLTGDDAATKKKFLLSSSSMMIKSMLKRTEEHFNGTEYHNKLKELLATVDAQLLACP